MKKTLLGGLVGGLILLVWGVIAWMVLPLHESSLRRISYPQGSEPFMPARFLIGFIVNFIAAFFAAWFLARSTAAASSYMARVAFCGMLGIFASFAVHLPYWNWMYFPFDHTTAMIADTVLGWVLAGLGIAAIVKPPKMEAA